MNRINDFLVEHSYCEVIGCMREASWMLRNPDDYRCEDYLCHVHWELLRVPSYRRACRYVHLSSIFSEGMGLVPCMQFALIGCESAPSAAESVLRSVEVCK